ncbi:MAG: hypothetical protein WC974_09145 [Thermoplasmata archaeon]
MKQLIFIILLLFTVSISAQDYTASAMSSKNTTTTVLDSAGAYTGTAELLRGYNSLSVTIRADQSGTYKILFGNTSTITTANAVKTYSFSYTANDTLHTKTVGVDAPYVKVVFTSSGVVAQTKFYLITMLNKADVLPRTTDGKLDVTVAGLTLTQAQMDSLQKAVQQGTWNINNVSGTISLPTGASTSANQTTLLGYLHPATISLSVPAGTVSTEVDTTTITATTWFTFSVFAVDDTLQIALKGDFSDAITVYPFSVGNFINQDPVTFPKAYIRRNTGGAGTVTYQSKVSGY